MRNKPRYLTVTIPISEKAAKKNKEVLIEESQREVEYKLSELQDAVEKVVEAKASKLILKTKKSIRLHPSDPRYKRAKPKTSFQFGRGFYDWNKPWVKAISIEKWPDQTGPVSCCKKK